MVSGTVHSLAHKQLSLAFDFAGEQQIKNSDDRVPTYRVRMAGRNLPDIAVAEDADSGEPRSASPEARFTAAGMHLDGFWAWLVNQPKLVRFSIGVIIFFFLVNLLTSGLLNPWFIYPSAPFAIFAFLSLRSMHQRDRLPTKDE